MPDRDRATSGARPAPARALDPRWLEIVGLVATLIGLIAVSWRRTAHFLVDFGRHVIPCPRCGYNLTGLREAQCPECGADFTLDEIYGELANERDEAELN